MASVNPIAEFIKYSGTNHRIDKKDKKEQMFFLANNQADQNKDDSITFDEYLNYLQAQTKKPEISKTDLETIRLIEIIRTAKYPDVCIDAVTKLEELANPIALPALSELLNKAKADPQKNSMIIFSTISAICSINTSEASELLLNEANNFIKNNDLIYLSFFMQTLEKMDKATGPKYEKYFLQFLNTDSLKKYLGNYYNKDEFEFQIVNIIFYALKNLANMKNKSKETIAVIEEYVISNLNNSTSSNYLKEALLSKELYTIYKNKTVYTELMNFFKNTNNTELNRGLAAELLTHLQLNKVSLGIKLESLFNEELSLIRTDSIDIAFAKDLSADFLKYYPNRFNYSNHNLSINYTFDYPMNNNELNALRNIYQSTDTSTDDCNKIYHLFRLSNDSSNYTGNSLRRCLELLKKK